MKQNLIKIIGILLVLFFSQSNSFAVEANCVEVNTVVECDINGLSFEIKGTTTPFVAEQVFSYLHFGRVIDLKNPVDINSLFFELTYKNATPNSSHWILPELSILKLMGRKIENIHGAELSDLYQSAKKVRWSQYDGYNFLNRYSFHRITGKFNALTRSVQYSADDLSQHYIQDIEVWALHELFGLNSIPDKNYKASILTSMLINKELSVMEYSDLLLYLTPLEDIPINPFLYEESDDDHGGITGVEGGGDIVAASIKKMILQRLIRPNQTRPFFEIADLMNFDVAYQPNYNLVLPTIIPARFILSQYRIGVFLFPGISPKLNVLLVSNDIRLRWHEMSLDERNQTIDLMLDKIIEEKGMQQ